MNDGMFGEHTDLYDLIYAGKDYGGEAELLHEILKSRGVAEGGHILEAACGTGRYMALLDKWYEVSGFDLSPQMVERARQRLGVLDRTDGPLGPDRRRLFVADMADFSIDDSVNGIVCLFSSIGYIHGVERLKRVLKNFYGSLTPGGLAVIEPWVGPDKFEVGRPSMDTYADNDIKICRQTVADRKDRLAILEFDWLIARRDDAVEHFRGRHELYLYRHDEYLEAMESAGFEVEHDQRGLMGRGLYIGRKSAD